MSTIHVNYMTRAYHGFTQKQNTRSVSDKSMADILAEKMSGGGKGAAETSEEIRTGTRERYYTPYRTNTNVKMISGFSLNADGKLEVQEAGEESDFKGFVAEFVDYQKFYKEWMSQGTSTAFSYTENKGLNKEENSISLVPGMRAKLANGFVIAIKDRIVEAQGDFRDNEASKESVAIAGALNSLIKVANGQIPMNLFYRRNVDNSAYAKKGLEAFGIDTSREFMINERKFHFDNEGALRLGEKK